MTIAFDLDGTLAEATWPSPKIGEPIDKGINAALEYRKRGYEVIIFTSRPSSHREHIGKWLVDNGLRSIFYDIITDKPRYAMFIDDRAVTFPEAFEERTGASPTVDDSERADRAIGRSGKSDPRARYRFRDEVDPDTWHYFTVYCGARRCVRLPDGPEGVESDSTYSAGWDAAVAWHKITGRVQSYREVKG